MNLVCNTITGTQSSTNGAILNIWSPIPSGSAGQLLSSQGPGLPPQWIPSGGSSNYTPVDSLASPYTVLTTDYYIGCDPTGGVISLLFPDAPTIGRTFIIKDSTGKAGIHNITVTTVTGTDLFDGSTSYILNLPYQSITIVFNGTGYEVI